MVSFEEDIAKLKMDEQFLFREEEFDDQEFDAAQFVARYRRVTSLESLREQLVTYNQFVQKQLYSIINRDYKDFITITTKLDGLDTRVEMMMKPMFGLQMDMSSLQSGISGSLHLIQDKLDEQREIMRKKATIQKLLRVSSNMDLAKSALNMSTISITKAAVPSTDAQPVSSSKRNRLYRHSQHQIESQNKDLFVCSEYERAAVALHESQEDLADIAKNITSLQNTVSPAMVTELQKNFEITKDNLVTNVKTHLEHYFSSAATEKKIQKDAIAISSSTVDTTRHHRSNTLSETSQIQLHCYGHCLRAVLSLGRGDIAEAALRSAVIEPYVKNAFSVGKVDGKQGRGTYSGLAIVLQEMIQWMENSQLPLLLSLAEEITSITASAAMENQTSSFNLILHSVWDPVVHVLYERFPTMLSVGITSVFSHCFRAMDRFAQHLLRQYPTAGTRGLYAALDTYYKTWKLDLYFQLRSREIMTRVDAICDHQLSVIAPSTNAKSSNNISGKSHVLKGDLLALAYTPSSADINSISNAQSERSMGGIIAGHKNRLQTALTLDGTQLNDLSKQISALIASTASNKSPAAFHHEIYLAMAMEMCLVTHEDVALSPMLTQCLGLNVRVLQRFVYHIILLCHASTFPLQSTTSVSSPSALEDVGLDSSAAGAGYNPNAATYSKFEQLRAEYLGAILAAANTTASLSIDELLFHFQDLLHFHAFATHYLQERYLPRILSSANEVQTSSTLQVSDTKKSQRVFERIVSTSLQPILLAANAIWLRILFLVTQDCKRPLTTAVKAIAGKYRMTNKPAPTSASPYVATILEPLDLLLRAKQDPEQLVVLFTMLQTGNSQKAMAKNKWKEHILEEITQVYLEQVVTLLDTVRQMDSALQRRQQQRSKQQSANMDNNVSVASGVVTDSDKIYLQVKLDVQEYAQMMLRVLSPSNIGSSNPLVELEEKVPAYCAILMVLQNNASINSSSVGPPVMQNPSAT